MTKNDLIVVVIAEALLIVPLIFVIALQAKQINGLQNRLRFWIQKSFEKLIKK